MAARIPMIQNLECITQYARQLRKCHRSQPKLLTREQFNTVNRILDQIEGIEEMTEEINNSLKIRFYLFILIGLYNKLTFKYHFPSPFPERAWALVARFQASDWGKSPQLVKHEYDMDVIELGSSSDEDDVMDAIDVPSAGEAEAPRQNDALDVIELSSTGEAEPTRENDPLGVIELSSTDAESMMLEDDVDVIDVLGAEGEAEKKNHSLDLIELSSTDEAESVIVKESLDLIHVSGTDEVEVVREKDASDVIGVAGTDEAEALGQQQTVTSDDELDSEYKPRTYVRSHSRLPSPAHPIYGIEGIMRGIIVTNSPRRSYLIDPSFKKGNANVFGHNGFKVGDWWPLQTCALRDGAHGAKVSGISGTIKNGAYSVVLSGTYDNLDADRGDTLYYCGSYSLENRNPTAPISAYYTNSLRVSREVEQPVRVLRNSRSNSPWSPSHGIRYDGLYTVTGEETRYNSHGGAYVRFRLERVSEQAPIDMNRPTKEEIALCERVPLTY